MITTYFFKLRYYQILLMSLMVLLPSSSFFFTPYLTYQIQQGVISSKELAIALKLHIPNAHQFALTQQKEYSVQWFKYAFVVAKTDALLAFKLGNYFLAAHKVTQAELWYKNSLALGYEQAANQLAVLYIQQGSYLKAKTLLTLYLHNEHNLAYALELAITAGDKDFIVKNWQRLEASTHYQFLLQEIKNYGVISFFSTNVELKPQSHSPLNICSNSIQLFATSLTSLRKSVNLINTFQQHPLADYICFKPPRYIAEHFLACQQQIKGAAISCDESIWQKYPEKINARYLAIMLPKGGANVHMGILYLDAQDNSDVLIHEVTHLLGFIDEYPLIKTHKACQNIQQVVGHNFIVLPQVYTGDKKHVRNKILNLLPWGKLILPSTPILTKFENKWQLGTPVTHGEKLGVFLAKGCEATSLQAYKPLKKASALEYLDENFPAVYLKILALAPNKYLMPSYKKNIKSTQ